MNAAAWQLPRNLLLLQVAAIAGYKAKWFTFNSYEPSDNTSSINFSKLQKESLSESISITSLTGYAHRRSSGIMSLSLVWSSRDQSDKLPKIQRSFFAIKVASFHLQLDNQELIFVLFFSGAYFFGIIDS